MTYEDLLVCIADESPRLSHCGLRLLLQLVAIAIETGTNELAVSQAALRERLQMSREGVARGMRDLAHIVRIEYSNGNTSVFTMPPEWFAPQRSLFGAASGLDSRPERPTFQAGTGQLSRPERPKFQAGAA